MQSTLLVATLLIAAPAAAQAAARDPKPEPIRVETQPLTGLVAERPHSVASLIRPNIKIGRRGELAIGKAKVAIYVPKLRRFPIENTGDAENSMSNQSGFLYVDQNGDGKLPVDESWHLSMPIRIHDRMFEVTKIAPRGEWIELTASTTPLRGVEVGRALPPFEYRALDNSRVTHGLLTGKHWVIQIWSPT